MLSSITDEAPVRQTGPGLGIKRAIDIVVAGTALVATAPILISAALAIRAFNGTPVLFRHARPGRGSTPFTLLKFRTMRPAGEGGPHSPGRLTALGRLLRRTSVDELPQLFNVLKGEMSLVGPRPLLMEYLPRYTPSQARRQEVLPGITGWAVVNGRNALSWDEKFALDVWYVDHWTPWLDVKILIKTMGLVLAGRGVSPDDGALMPEFKGARDD